MIRFSNTIWHIINHSQLIAHEFPFRLFVYCCRTKLEEKPLTHFSNQNSKSELEFFSPSEYLTYKSCIAEHLVLSKEKKRNCSQKSPPPAPPRADITSQCYGRNTIILKKCTIDSNCLPLAFLMKSLF
jgi:hypothetical protein